MVTFEVKAMDIYNIRKALADAADHFKSVHWASRPIALAAHFQGLQEMASKKYELDQEAMLKVSISEDAIKLLLRALRTKVHNTTAQLRWVDSEMWSRIYYGIREQIDQSIWKQAQML